METIKLTKKEEEWIKELKKLMRKKPKSLILFANGDLNILKGSKENPSCETEEWIKIELQIPFYLLVRVEIFNKRITNLEKM